jgi:hypothetical protein
VEGIIKLLIKRAFKETCILLGWKWILLLVAIFTTLFGWFYLWAFGQAKVVFGEMNTVTAYGAGLLTTGALFFIINLFRAPLLIIQEKDMELSSLKQEKHKLEAKICPKLSIVHTHASPWVQVLAAQNPTTHVYDNGYLYTYRISIANTGAEVVRNIRVKIASIIPPELRGTPHHLHFTNDNREPHAETRDLPMTLDDESGLFVDVITYWRGGDERQRMSFNHIASGVSGEVPVKTYEFGIFVSSDNGGQTIHRRCRFVPRLDAAPILEFI